MSIEIKISKKRIPYKRLCFFLIKELRCEKGKNKELLWILEHPSTYTAGLVLTKKILLIKK